MKISPLVSKLLVFVGIPCLGLAIVFPAFTHARENARRASCQSNLKQIGLGLLQYTQDYDGHLPPVKGSDHPTQAINGNPAFGWADALQPYVKSTCLLNCPSDLFPPDFQTIKGSYTDYYMNARLSGAKWNNPRATNIVLAGDGIGDKHATARYALSSPPDEKQVCGGYNGACESVYRHLGTANFLFLDGHVKFLQPGAVTATKGDAATFAP